MGIDKQYFKCKLCRSDLTRFRLICKYLNMTMSEACGNLIKEFVLDHQEDELCCLIDAIKSHKNSGKKDYQTLKSDLDRLVGLVEAM